MSQTIPNAAGESVNLSINPQAQGDEAVVYGVPKLPSIVVKTYHDPVLWECTNLDGSAMVLLA